jgi:hypothetical protein
MADRIEFEISPELMAEAESISTEMGLSISDMAKNAFEGYMDGVRTARLDDLDEPDSTR